MPFSQTFQRLAVLLEPEVARMQERQAQRVLGHDTVKYVPSERAVVYLRGGSSVWIARAELLARLPLGYGLLRWWWYGNGPRASGRSRLDAILAEGQQNGVKEFTTESVAVDDDAAAETLCKVAAFIARADGLLRVDDAQAVSYLALYDAPGARITPPEPPTGRGMSVLPTTQARPPARIATPVPKSIARPSPSTVAPPSSSSLRVAPPIGGIDTDEPFQNVEPSTSIRGTSLAPSVTAVEPPREMMLPVVQRAMSEITTDLGTPFQKAMMIISVGVREGKARFSVSLVSLDLSGELQAHEASAELCAAVGDLIAQHSKLPGGRWRRLITRFKSTPRGASVDVSVDG